MQKEDLFIGRYVHYAPSHGRTENGRVKAVTDHGVFVVYKCGGNWDSFENYTGQNTPIEDLRPAWVNEKEEMIKC